MANGLFGGGDGTENSPYLVEDWADIEAIKGHLAKPGVYFQQSADIEFSGSNWEPIGDWNNGPFMGEYDGWLYKISDVVVNAPEGGSPVGGLFGFTYSGSKVSSVILDGVTVVGAESTDMVGGLVGQAQGDIDKCVVINPKIDANKYVGGLAGMSVADIRNCAVNGDDTSYVKGSAYVGGLVGQTDSASEIEDSYAIVDVESSATDYSYVGGLIGNPGDGSSVYRVYAAGAVTGTGEYVGGLLGFMGPETSFYDDGFYDTEKSGQSDTGKGVPLTTEQFSDQSIFTDVGWDFDWTWEMGESRPNLQIEPEPGLDIPVINYEGEGTKDNPYLVSTPEELAGIHHHLGNPAVYFKQTADIDLKDYGTWIPIGDFDTGPFMGEFDGGHFKVENMKAVGLPGHNAGLFGFTMNGLIKGTHVYGSVEGSSMAGGIAGQAQGAIEDSSFEGTVNSTGDYVGGIAGMAMKPITRCYAIGTVTGSDTVGGIVGLTNNIASVIDSYSVVTVSATTTTDTGGSIGGLVAGATGGEVKHTYALGTVSAPGMDEFASVGGLIGFGSITVTNSYFNLEGTQELGDFGTPKLPNQFADQATFEGWDFENTWKMGSERPHLYYEVLEDPSGEEPGVEEPGGEKPTNPPVDGGAFNFSETSLIRDKFGTVVPQVWDRENNRWVVIALDGSYVSNVR